MKEGISYKVRDKYFIDTRITNVLIQLVEHHPRSQCFQAFNIERTFSRPSDINSAKECWDEDGVTRHILPQQEDLNRKMQPMFCLSKQECCRDESLHMES